MVKISNAYPDVRAECVTAITEQLGKFAKTSPELNGFLVAYLLDLNAVESAETLERAFAAKRIELSIAGDWLDAQLALGLKTRAEVRQIRTTVDAEHIQTKAAKPTAQKAQGFGLPQRQPQKGKHK